MAVHAAVEHACKWPIETYHTDVVAVLESPDEYRLQELWNDLEAKNLYVVPFHEPDLNDELVSLAIITGKVPSLSRLPLLFSRSQGRG